MALFQEAIRLKGTAPLTAFSLLGMEGDNPSKNLSP